MRAHLAGLLSPRDRGATAVEYGLAVALVLTIGIGVVILVG